MVRGGGCPVATVRGGVTRPHALCNNEHSQRQEPVTTRVGNALQPRAKIMMGPGRGDGEGGVYNTESVSLVKRILPHSKWHLCGC